MARVCDPGLNALDWENRRTLAHWGFAETSIPSPVGMLTLFTAGSGQPLLLLHGAGDHAGAWAKTAPALLASRRYRILIPDLPGHGTSEPAEGPLNMEIFLAAVDTIIDRAGSAPMILAGNSLGAWLSFIWTDLHPERVERIVAVNGGPITGIREELTLRPTNHAEARAIWEALVDAAYWQIPSMGLDELIRKGRAGAISRLDSGRMRAFVLDGRLDGFLTPVDLIWGESDRMVPLEYARRVEAGLPAVRLTTIPRCGHVPQLECAGRFNTVLQHVLRQPAPGRKSA